MANLINNLFKARLDLFAHVGFLEMQPTHAISDETEYYWRTNEGQITYGDTVLQVESDLINSCTNYTTEVYTGDDYTMILVGTGTVKYYAIFDNSKKI